ncbi:MAG: hypothetical protein ABSG53_24960, partial [Thermoguttaceae bacterium]
MGEVPAASTGHSRVGSRWLLGISILAAASGVAWLLVARLDMRWIACWVVTAAIGWVSIRFAHADTKGVVLWYLAVVALSMSFRALLHGSEGGLEFCCGLTGLILSVTSCVVFLVAATRDRTRRRRNCACFNLALFT